MTVEEIRAIISNIEYKDWEFYVGVQSDAGWVESVWLQVQFKTRNCVTGEHYIAHGRKWLLSLHMVKSEIVGTALKAVLTAEEHEARECFKFGGKAVFNPHIDVDALAAVCDSVEVRP